MATLRASMPVCIAVAVAAAVGCGSSGPGAGPAPARPPAVIATPRLGADDVQVASVNGRPVWASCVAAQARTLPAAAGDPARRTAALDQCIAFELLAQAAEARGLAAAPEVAEAARGAAVNRLVETDFEQRYRTPADLAPQVDAVMKTNEWRLHVLELRASAFARFAVPKDAPAGVDARARALAERLAGELRGQTGLFDVHLFDAAKRIAEGSGITLNTADFRPAHHDDLVEAYAAALYGIPEVGRTSEAFRSPWGWDVVLWTGGVEAHERSRDEVVAELFPEIRRREFAHWALQIGKQLGVHVSIDEAVVARLDSEAAP